MLDDGNDVFMIPNGGNDGNDGNDGNVFMIPNDGNDGNDGNDVFMIPMMCL